MSYVYVYIYTLYTGAKVCVYVYAVSGKEARVQYRRADAEMVSLVTIDHDRRERMSKKVGEIQKERKKEKNRGVAIAILVQNL